MGRSTFLRASSAMTVQVLLLGRRAQDLWPVSPETRSNQNGMRVSSHDSAYCFPSQYHDAGRCQQSVRHVSLKRTQPVFALSAAVHCHSHILVAGIRVLSHRVRRRFLLRTIVVKTKGGGGLAFMQRFVLVQAALPAWFVCVEDLSKVGSG
jgi:hypothetical protein